MHDFIQSFFHSVFLLLLLNIIIIINIMMMIIVILILFAKKGMELRIDKPDQDGNGEICFRGRHIFMGYLFNEAKTRVCFPLLHSFSIVLLSLAPLSHLACSMLIRRLSTKRVGCTVATLVAWIKMGFFSSLVCV